MKYIFDFDDILFNNTAQFKPHMFKLLAEAGAPEADARVYYQKVRAKEFSLRDFITTLLTRYGITNITPGALYEDIMRECHNFLNLELMEEIKKIGKENCYIVSNGENDFNWDKIRYSGVLEFFDIKNVHVVPDTKKFKIKEICDANKNSDVIFIDDKVQFTRDTSLKDCPNLTTIMYRGEKLAGLVRKINSRENKELRIKKIG